MAKPLISIGMSIYNAGSFLRLALKSVLFQTFRDWELILLDDGSSDNAVNNNIDILKDPRIKIIQDGKNFGLANRLNQAINLAQGDYFARMDGDDISFPDRLGAQLMVLENNSDLDLLGTRYLTINDTETPIGVSPSVTRHLELTAAPWRGFYVAHPTWMGKKSWFANHLYAQPAPYCCEDQELLLRTYKNSIFANLPEILFAYRIRDGINLQKSLKTRIELLKIRSNLFQENKDYSSLLKSYLNYSIGSSHDLLSQLPLLNINLRKLSIHINEVSEFDAENLKKIVSLLKDV